MEQIYKLMEKHKELLMIISLRIYFEVSKIFNFEILHLKNRNLNISNLIL